MQVLARLSRIIPVLLVIAAIAAVIFLVVSFLHSSTRAKEVLIKLFTALFGALSVFCALFTLYALFEQNAAVFDFAASFLLTSLICLGITLICRTVFLRNHPEYKDPAMRARLFPHRRKR